MKPKPDDKCDICGKPLKAKCFQEHHLIPSKLRTTAKDQLDKVLLCPNCHHQFHQAVNFADVSGRSKQYFKKKYLEYRASYIYEKYLYDEHQKEKDKKDETND